MDYQCPTSDQPISCPYVDTAGMTKTKSCYKCDHYNNGVRRSPGLYIPSVNFSWFTNLFRNLKFKRNEVRKTLG